MHKPLSLSLFLLAIAAPLLALSARPLKPTKAADNGEREREREGQLRSAKNNCRRIKVAPLRSGRRRMALCQHSNGQTQTLTQSAATPHNRSVQCVRRTLSLSRPTKPLPAAATIPIRICAQRTAHSRTDARTAKAPPAPLRGPHRRTDRRFGGSCTALTTHRASHSERKRERERHREKETQS